MANPVLHGAIAIIKSKGITIGLMRDVRVNDNIRRVEVRGLGTILPQEAPATSWAGSISCSFYEVDYAKAGVPNAIRRDVGDGNAASQVGNGTNTPNFEDQIVLDVDGVSIEIFKKIKDVIDTNTQLIIPKAVPYAICNRCLIETDNVNIQEGQVAGRDQTFMFLDPIIRNP